MLSTVSFVTDTTNTFQYCASGRVTKEAGDGGGTSSCTVFLSVEVTGLSIPEMSRRGALLRAFCVGVGVVIFTPFTSNDALSGHRQRASLEAVNGMQMRRVCLTGEDDDDDDDDEEEELPPLIPVSKVKVLIVGCVMYLVVLKNSD